MLLMLLLLLLPKIVKPVVSLVIVAIDGKLVDVEKARAAEKEDATDGDDRDIALEKCLANCSWLQQRNTADATMLLDMFDLKFG